MRVTVLEQICRVTRAVYYMLKNKVAFDQEEFLRTG
jgi:hypothetical protein